MYESFNFPTPLPTFALLDGDDDCHLTGCKALSLFLDWHLLDDLSMILNIFSRACGPFV